MIFNSLLLITAVTVLAQSLPATGLSELRAAAKANFMAHAVGSPTVDSAARLPPAGDANLAELRIILQSAREIQLGCVLPCSQREDALIYIGKVELVGKGLGLDLKEASATVRRYAPEGKPRLRPAGYPQGAISPGDRLIEGRVMERIIAEGRMAGEMRRRLALRASALADALGNTRLISADGVGTASGGLNTGRKMTREQIAALNALPNAQAEILRKWATSPPPPPVDKSVGMPMSNGLLRLPEPTDYFDGKQYELTWAVYKEAEQIMKDPNYKHGTYPVFYRFAPDRTKKSMIAWEILMQHRYGGEEKLAERYAIKGITAGEVADVDHFFAGALIGAVPALGTVACGIGTVAYDGAQSAYDLAHGNTKSAAYNFKQMGSDAKGCLYGFTILAPGG